MKNNIDKQDKNNEEKFSFITRMLNGEFSLFQKFKKKDKTKKLTSKNMDFWWFIKYVLKGALAIIFALSLASYFSMLLIVKTESVEGGIILFIGLLFFEILIFFFYRKLKAKSRKEQLDG